MMSFRFNPHEGLILIPSQIEGPSGKALGQSYQNFPVLAHTLPPSAGVDGLLGLDFLREKVIHIDFQNGQIQSE